MRHHEACFFKVSTDTEEKTDLCWNVLVGDGGKVSAWGWRKDHGNSTDRSTRDHFPKTMVTGGAKTKRDLGVMIQIRKSTLPKSKPLLEAD